MILVDTSIWIDHLRSANADLSASLLGVLAGLMLAYLLLATLGPAASGLGTYGCTKLQRKLG